MTEALSHTTAWLDETRRFEHSVCLISPANVASIRVAERTGYIDPKPARFIDADSLMFSRAYR